MKVLLSVLLLLSIAAAFYETDSKVVKLTVANFQSEVLDSEELWLVEFYAPWCGHCKKLAPHYDKAAKALDGIVKMGALDMTTDGDAARDYNVTGYPTIKFFGVDKSNPVAYEGDRKKNEIIDFLLDHARSLALSRLGLKAKASAPEDANVVVLTDDNFDELVMNSQEPWFVKFYAPWCKHCKKLAPEWNRLANKVKGEFNIAKVDATVQTNLAKRFGVESFPSIKFFPPGEKSDQTAQEFGGDREYAELLQFLKKSKDKYKKVVFEQLTSQQTLTQLCSAKKGTCLISFLPPLSQSTQSERTAFLDILQETSESQRSRNLSYLWAQGGDYEELEAELNLLGDGYPAAAIVNYNTNKFYKLKASFNKDTLTSFITSVFNEKENGYDFKDLPQLETVEKWRRDDL